jgi:hypothetical protein
MQPAIAKLAPFCAPAEHSEHMRKLMNSADALLLAKADKDRIKKVLQESLKDNLSAPNTLAVTLFAFSDVEMALDARFLKTDAKNRNAFKALFQKAEAQRAESAAQTKKNGPNLVQELKTAWALAQELQKLTTQMQ